MLSIAWKNVARRLGSSAMTVLVVAIAVFSIVSSALVLDALDRGPELSRQRLGADVMVVPAGVSAKAESVLFTAQPVNVYFSPSVAASIGDIEGVDQITPQFFTQTVDQSCCSLLGATRVVGLDFSSDFTVSPWLQSGSVSQMGRNGIVLGSSVRGIEGGQASILGETFLVCGTLEPTGTSVDDTIFMDIDSARDIAMQSPYLKSIWEGADAYDSLSCVMVKVDDGADAQDVASSIMAQCPGVSAVVTSGLVSGASAQLSVLSNVALFMVCLIAVVSACALIGRFDALVSGRASEIALMRLMGLGLARSAGVVVLEAAILLAMGTSIACVLACFASGFAIDYLHASLQLPNALVNAGVYARAVLFGVVFAIALGGLSFIGPFARHMKNDVQTMLARGGLR